MSKAEEFRKMFEYANLLMKHPEYYPLYNKLEFIFKDDREGGSEGY